MITLIRPLLATLIFVLIGCKSSEEYKQAKIDKYDKGIYATNVSLGSPIYKLTPSRAFNGDGESLYVFELPKEIRDRFKAPDAKLLSKYPKLPNSRKGWSVMTWREAPFEPNLNKYLNFALYGAGKYSEEVQEALSRKGTYYALFHYDHGDNPGNIDLFIVDLIKNKIYEINVNT